jgi:hypothetical protein
MNVTAVQPGRSTRRRRVLLLLASGILILLAVHTVLDFWASRAVKNEVARLEQRYGSLDPATLVLPAVPAQNNRARIVRAAAALAVPVSTEVQHATFEFINKGTSTSVPVAVREFADANRRALAMAEEVRSRTQSGWETDPRTGRNQPTLLEIRLLASAIYVSSMIELEAGRTDEAAKVLSSGLGVAASLRQEPQLLAQLVRIAVTIPLCEAVEQLIARAEPSKVALEHLATWLAENRTPDPITVGMLGEVKLANAGLMALESRSDMDLQDIRVDHPNWSRLPARVVGRPFIRLARLRFLRTAGGLLDLQMSARPRPPFPVRSDPAFWNVSAKLAETLTPGLERSIETGDAFASVLAATELGVALRRFQLERGRYPDDLIALVPAYLPRLPLDPFTGRPPVYARNGAGFTLRAESGKSFLRNSQNKSALDWTVEK